MNINQSITTQKNNCFLPLITYRYNFPLNYSSRPLGFEMVCIEFQEQCILGKESINIYEDRRGSVTLN